MLRNITLVVIQISIPLTAKHQFNEINYVAMWAY